MKKVFAALASVLLLGSLSACSQSTAEPLDTIEAIYSQPLMVKNCGGGFKCGTVKAPINWNDASRGTFELSFTFKPVDGVERYLFVNPGGPGSSGVSFVKDGLEDIGTAALRENYIVVGFDPRGTVGSAPVKCFDNKTKDEFLYSDTGFKAGTPEDLAAGRKAIAEFIDACSKNTGEVLGQIDTVSAAKDMDLLRAVFGQDKLDYLGFSYGTFLGTTYAALFPEKVGAFVLDGAVDPTVSDEEQNLNQLKGFDLALRNYLADCLKNDADCPFTGSVEAGLKRISDFLSEVELKPLKSSDGRQVGLSAAETGMYLTLYSDEYWTYLTQAFNEAFDMKDGSTFIQLADFYNGREQDGSYPANDFEAFVSINCLDKRGDSSPAAVAAQNERILQASPTLGRFWLNGSELCSKWPYPQAKAPESYAAQGSPTILVIGTTGDPATPYHQSVDLARKVLANGLLVTFEGEGHTAYGRSNDCIANVVDDFLIDGVVPKQEVTC